MDESVEKLGMDLQRLGQKAFPSLKGPDLDRLLKGRFYQAFLPKWQRKLRAPHPEETFAQLFERAHIVEHHHRQYAESAASCEGGPKTDKAKPNFISKPHPTDTHRTICLCFICEQPGHMAHRCPDKDKYQEAPRQLEKNVSHISCLEARCKAI